MTSNFAKNAQSDPFSVIFSDVDFFKSINDTYGHTVGDRVLIELAKLLQHESCAGELVARYGGEEFVILCPTTKLEQAVRRAERLRVAVERSAMGGLNETSVTASFGVAQVEAGDSVESILRRADKALYMAKASGRNCTCSLTNAELLAGLAKQEPQQESEPDPFLFVGRFEACVAADMVVYKMGGFVNDHSAQLIEVTPKRAVVRMGRRGLLPFWGSVDDRRPIELEVEFGDQSNERGRKQRAAAQFVGVDVRIRPLGWVRDAEAFQARSKRVLKVLRSYFAAE
jgi:diguanylate cyclase (GGDEF)-like protein